jgi:peptide/nickel transport system substrate-binding protein
MDTLSYKRLFTLSVLVAMTLLLALAACSIPSASEATGSPTAVPPTATPEPPTPTPLPRGGNLTVRLAEDIPRLQPWRPETRGAEQIISLLYSGLVRLDEELRPQPDLAEAWDISADGRIITFTLRQDVTWHDGQPMDAVDVHFTLDRMRALPHTTTALLSDLRHVAGIATPDTHTVVMSLTERYAPLLAELTMPILPRHLLEDKDFGTFNFWDEPVGTGPFQLERLDRGHSVILERYNGYYRGAPLLDYIVFLGAADSDIALQALQDGRLLLAEMNWNTVRGLTDTLDMVRIGGYPENAFYYLAFNVRDGHPFADLQVRQALVRAINLPKLIETATKGQGIPIGSSAAPGSWADLTPPPSIASESDLQAARGLLAEAGWTLPEGATIRQRDGEPFRARLFVRGDDSRRLAAARSIAEIASSIGLQIIVEPADFSTVIVSKYAPPYDFDVLLGSWSNGAGDPAYADYLFYDPDDFALFHSSQINQGPVDTRITRNIVGFRDTIYDNQAQAARQLYGIDARAEAIVQAQARVASQLPYLYLWVDRIPVGLNTCIKTLDGPVNLSIPNYFWNIERWHFSQEAVCQEIATQ